MSFLTSLLQGIGSVASTVGQGIGTAATAAGKAIGIGSEAGPTAMQALTTTANAATPGVTWADVVAKSPVQGTGMSPANAADVTGVSDMMGDYWQRHAGETFKGKQASSGWENFVRASKAAEKSPLGQLIRHNVKLGSGSIKRYEGPEESKYVALKSKFGKGRGPALEQGEGFKLDRYDKAMLEVMKKSWEQGKKQKAEMKAVTSSEPPEEEEDKAYDDYVYSYFEG